jgi:DNA-binding HxlR family transcriptional regulator
MNHRSETPFRPLSIADAPSAVFGRCPTHWLVRQLAGRWSLQVLSLLHSSPRRFTQLRKELQPISPRMLGRTLKKLTQMGFVRHSELGAPPQLRYEVTDLGRSVSEPLGRLLDWSQQNAGRIDAMSSGHSEWADTANVRRIG